MGVGEGMQGKKAYMALRARIHEHCCSVLATVLLHAHLCGCVLQVDHSDLNSPSSVVCCSGALQLERCRGPCRAAFPTEGRDHGSIASMLFQAVQE